MYRLWLDPGEQINVLDDGEATQWVKSEAESDVTEITEWITNEIKDAPLPITSNQNEKQARFYRGLVLSKNYKNLGYTSETKYNFENEVDRKVVLSMNSRYV